MDVVWKLADSDLTDVELTKEALKAYVDRWVEEGWPHPNDMTMEQADMYSPRGPRIAAETLINYIEQRRPFIKEGEVLAVEQPFAVPLGEDTDDLYIGRLDKVFRHPREGTVVIEHKSTTLYSTKGGLRPQYIDQWSPNSQVDGYIHAAHMLYKNVRGVWIDAALFHKQHHGIFKFIPVDRQFAALDQWLAETRSWIERVEFDVKDLEENKNIGTAFPKNTGSCGNYAGCTYRDICKFYIDPTKQEEPPPGFITEKWEPFDILKLQKIGLEKENA